MSTYSNTTDDIMYASCFSQPISVIACTRYAIMSAIILLTAVLCIVRIYKLHRIRHEALHHYLIFYSSTVCCLLCAIHWILGQYAQLEFLAQWFKQLSYLVVTHFYWSRAHRAIRRERLTNLCLVPGLTVGFVYCTVTVVLGAVMVFNYESACHAVEWVMMSSAELLIVQVFLIAAFFISRRLDSISTTLSVRTSQKRKLWGLVITFEFSAVFGFSYDLTIRLLANPYDDCGDIFNNNQLLYSCVFGLFMIIKFAVPIWALLATLEPVPVLYITEENDSDSLHSSDQVTVGDQRTFYIPRLFQSLVQSDNPSS